MKKYFYLTGVLFLCIFAISGTYADNLNFEHNNLQLLNKCDPKGGGMLDLLLFGFLNNATLWIAETNKVAHKIFILLFTMEFLWQVIVGKIFMGDIEKLWVFFLVRMIVALFFDKYIINIELYKGIIAYMSNIGMTISLHALDPNINMNGHFNDLGPSKVISYFACVSDLIHIGADKSGAVDYITLKIALAALEIILFVILSIIAYCMLEVYVQMYFLLYAGFVLTGFAGSSWTNAFWQKYVHSVSYIAIKFFVISILMGLMLSTVEMWTDQISQTVAQENNGAGITAAIMNILCSAIILVFMIKELPNWAAKSLSATVKLRG